VAIPGRQKVPTRPYQRNQQCPMVKTEPAKRISRQSSRVCPLPVFILCLASVLIATTGSYQPTQIPVNVYFPSESASNSESLFEPAVANSPCIKMTIPERPPISGLVEISVRMDLAKPKGVSVDVSGALSADLDINVLEEVCRRGGTLSLPGRVWNGTRLS
jgi:hypothetical protein